MKTKEKTRREPLFHIVKRSDIKSTKAWLIRLIAGLIAFLLCGIVGAIMTGGEFLGFYANLFKGAFGSSRRVLNLFQGIAILLCISLAVAPAFRMKFWNIGAEGQVLVSGLACAACMMFLGGKMPDAVLILIMAAASIGAGIIWSVIPAIFKAQWNTNETLFTLMMNYIAMNLVGFCINLWVPSGSGVVGILQHGNFPKIGGYAYILNIIIVAVLTALVYVYMRFSKHGYEVSVVGESENTAKYIGINVKKVIIRTMILCGAICGIAGLLLVGGSSFTITKDIVAGRGFTAILVAWLARFNPIVMFIMSFFVVFLQQGAAQVVTTYGLGASAAFSDVITGIFFFLIIGCEFFINYQIKFRSTKKEAAVEC